MNSLCEFLSSPLLDFATGSKHERPDELDMLLETLSDSDIQLLDSTVTDKHLDSTNSSVTKNIIANASVVSCQGTCSSHTIDHTLPLVLLL